jgi:high-affinity nickel-transport protein
VTIAFLGALGSTAFAAAFTFGLRHGVDWDHIAALSDLTSAQTTPRRSMVLATLYALGHAVVVLILGLVAILFAEQLPDSVDVAMERVVGVTLLALGAYVAWTLIRYRGALPMQSRWMLLFGAIRRAVRRRRRQDVDDTVAIEHTHEHAHHGHGHGHTHTHDHDDAVVPSGSVQVAVRHSHTHRHVAVMPHDPFVTYGRWTAAGVGMLHGVGAETPTQVLIFAAAANASGRPTSVGLLVCFIVGLLCSNTLIAAAGAYGFLGVSRSRVFATVLSILVAAFSLVIGTLLLLGQGTVLPAIFSG